MFLIVDTIPEMNPFLQVRFFSRYVN